MLTEPLLLIPEHIANAPKEPIPAPIDYKRKTKLIYFSIVGISLFILSLLNRRVIMDVLKLFQELVHLKDATEIYDRLGNQIGFVDAQTGERVLLHEESYYAARPSSSFDTS